MLKAQTRRCEESNENGVIAPDTVWGPSGRRDGGATGQTPQVWASRRPGVSQAPSICQRILSCVYITCDPLQPLQDYIVLNVYNLFEKGCKGGRDCKLLNNTSYFVRYCNISLKRTTYHEHSED